MDRLSTTETNFGHLGKVNHDVPIWGTEYFFYALNYSIILEHSHYYHKNACPKGWTVSVEHPIRAFHRYLRG